MKRRNKKLCVQIARDVLLQLKNKRYEASPGNYVGLSGKSYWNLSFHEQDTLSFREFFKEKKDVTCQVCALGAAFVSLVNIKNQCSVFDVEDGNGMFSKLEAIFGAENMSLMETAFEGGMIGHGPYYDEVVMQAAINYGDRYNTSVERLRAIMKNVIRNSGDFKVPKKFLANVRLR